MFRQHLTNIDIFGVVLCGYRTHVIFWRMQLIVTIGGLCLHLCEVHYICCHMLANLANDYLRCAYKTLTIAEHMHDCNLFADRTPSLPQDVLHGCIESESDTGLKKLVMRPS